MKYIKSRMRWKVNSLLICTFLMSIHGQRITIEEHLDKVTTSNLEIINYEETNDTSTPTDGTGGLDSENETKENEIPENQSIENGNIDGQPVPDETLTPSKESTPSEEETQPSNEETQPSNEETEPSGEVTQPSVEVSQPSVEVTQPSVEVTQPSVEETEPSREESAAIRSSEEVEELPVDTNESVSVEDLPDGSFTEESIISTSHGPVQGHLWNESPNIISYIDIPYGRFSSLFQAPEPPESWEETHHIITHSKRCPQVQINEETIIEVIDDIDCLTLSVFVPRGAENASVLFHIYDGSFTSGSGNPSLYGPEYLLSKGIILVLPNYRLGPLGFLCLKNETAPGNAALKDLTLALNWTRENIAAFGGNPENIVVSGDGTSGALAGYLALSPASRDYISKVITETGSVVSHWAIDRDPITTATVLAERIRRWNENHTFNDNFFHEVEIKILLLGAQGIHLSPCVEDGPDPFISQTPWYILNNHKITKEFMIGSASFAGLHEALIHNNDSLSQMNKEFAKFLPYDLVFKKGKEEMLEVANSIKAQYFNEDEIDANSDKLALFYTDAWYLSPAIRTARVLLKASATVYFYEFAFVGDQNRGRIALGSQVNGSVRGDIVGYLFTQDGQMLDAGSSEAEMVDLMTDLWVSFINNGTPSSADVTWNQLKDSSEDEEEWLWIGPETQTRKGLHLDRLPLWTEVYENHFIEKSHARGLPLNPAVIIAAISVIGLFPKTMQVSR